MDDNSISRELAVSVAEYFGIDEKEASLDVEKITATVRENWEILAEKCGLSGNAREYMRPAFEICYR